MNNKKGGLNLSLENVIGLVIAAVLIPAIIIFSTNVTDLISAKPDQGTLNSFDALVKTINQLVETKDVTADGIPAKEYNDVTIIPNEENKLQVVVPLNIQPGFEIVGFDKGNSELLRDCISIKYPLKKPAQCTNLPCICLGKYKSSKSYDFLRCQSFDEVVFISATNSGEIRYNNGDTHSSGAGGQQLSISDICKVAKFDVKNIKIIKIPNGDKFNLLFEIPAK